MARKDKKTKKPRSAEDLSDWQKRNIEFLKQKQRESLDKAQAAKNLLNERKPIPQKRTDLAKPVRKKERSKAVKVKKNMTARQKALRKSLPIFMVATLFLLASFFFMTPFSQQKDLRVVGNQNTTADTIKRDTGIKLSDYVTSVWFQHKRYERQLIKANPWVKQATISYNFPNQFTIKVKEYRIFAYTMTNQGYQPILESGTVITEQSVKEIPAKPILQNFNQAQDIKELVGALTKLDKSLLAQIQSISLAPTKATKDLLQIETLDGPVLRIPLAEVATKLPYYARIKSQLAANAIVDMEAGIYTTTAELEEQVSSAREAAQVQTDATSDTADSSAEGQAEASQTQEAQTSESSALEE